MKHVQSIHITVEHYMLLIKIFLLFFVHNENDFHVKKMIDIRELLNNNNKKMFVCFFTYNYVYMY